jgi:hypothetical protein
MITVHKFQFKIADEFTIEMPRSAELLHVALQHDVPCVWALVNTDAPMTKRKFRLAGTGHPLGVRTYQDVHVGSFFQADGLLVWHLFDLGEER